MVEVDIVHCSDGDVVFAEVLSIDNGVLYGPADDFICPYCSIPVDVTKIVKNAFDLDWHFFEKYDFENPFDNNFLIVVRRMGFRFLYNL